VYTVVSKGSTFESILMTVMQRQITMARQVGPDISVKKYNARYKHCVPITDGDV
jgi:hypothetical protein